MASTPLYGEFLQKEVWYLKYFVEYDEYMWNVSDKCDIISSVRSQLCDNLKTGGHTHETGYTFRF